MKFVSTRGGESVDLDTALVQGIASDGGLFLPDVLPILSVEALSEESSERGLEKAFLAPFFEGSSIASQLDGIPRGLSFAHRGRRSAAANNIGCDLR